MSRVQADFSIALIQLKKGEKAARVEWPEGVHLEVHENENGPYLVEVHGSQVLTYVAYSADILATDWVQVA